MTQNSTKRFVLIDAFALIHRAFHGLPPLSTKDGQLVNAVYGFTAALLSAIKELKPEYLAVGFDLPKPTLRHKKYVEYKAHRAPAPDELVSQIPYVKEVLKTFNIPIVAKEGYEGEDVIATVVAKIKNQKSKCRMTNQNVKSQIKELNAKPYTLNASLEFIIVTGDMDTLQLIDDQTKVYSMARGVNQAVMYDKDKVQERYGLSPEQFVDFKALKGDPSDNIPGVPGIGEKGASNLIKQFGSLEKLYKEISNDEFLISKQIPIPNDKNIKKLSENIKISEKIIRLLRENKEQAILSQKLSKIETNVPLEFDIDDAKVHDFDKDKVISLFNKLGFKSLISRLPDSHRTNNQQKLL